ncbi:MAG: hypothetical protein R6U55_14845 [Desulfovermiculus sp.]
MRRTYGIYLLQQSSLVSLGVVDVDLVKRLRTNGLSSSVRSQIRKERDYLMSRLPEISESLDFFPLAEFSGGKGYHFWFFFEPPVPDRQARPVLNGIVNRLKGDVSCFELEVFPKQDTISGKGFGNLVKLPLGLRRVTGTRSYFLPRPGRGVWEDLSKLESVRISCLDQAASKAEKEKSAQPIAPLPSMAYPGRACGKS